MIPALIAELARDAGLELGKVQAKKGSLWVLTFVHEGRRLVDANYVPTPLPKP
ncbi:hypothetical protein GCM10029964_105470 [Kibdelosporangium lantanae]